MEAHPRYRAQDGGRKRSVCDWAGSCARVGKYWGKSVDTAGSGLNGRSRGVSFFATVFRLARAGAGALVLIGVAGCEGNLGARTGGSGESEPSAPGESPFLDSAERCDESARPAPYPSALLSRAQLLTSIEDLLGPTDLVLSDLPADTRTGSFVQAETHQASGDWVRQISTSANLVARSLSGEKIEALVPCQLESWDEICHRAFIEGLLERAFRRPPGEDEVQKFLDFLQSEEQAWGAEEAIRQVVEATLQSPAFLYRFERTQPSDGQRLAPVDDHALATRLSFLLVGGPPDESLRELARKGELADDEVLKVQTERLMGSEAGVFGVTELFRSWLELDFDNITKGSMLLEGLPSSESFHRGWEASFRQLMRHVLVENDGSIAALFTSESSFVQDDLRSVYSSDAPRAGLLTEPGLLAALAHDHSSPVLRGVFIRDHLLCAPIPPPPPGVDVQIPEAEVGPTTRDRYSLIQEQPSCAACHDLIHSIGFGLEHFDALGRYRTEENGAPIDASGSFVGLDDRRLDGTFYGVQELGAALAESDRVLSCMTKNLYSAAMARNLDGRDQCSIEEIAVESSPTDRRSVKEILISIVTSQRFRTRPVSDGGGS